MKKDSRCENCPSKDYDFEETRLAREKYRPERVKVLFISESPTSRMIDGRYVYFYFPGVPAKSHWLYRYTMEAVYGSVDLSRPREEYLQRFCDDGYYLLDAARCPVNDHSKQSKKNAIKSCSSLYLLPEIKQLQPSAILLIKANVYRMLRQWLVDEGFRVLNDRFIPFPSNGWQRNSRRGKGYVDLVRHFL